MNDEPLEVVNLSSGPIRYRDVGAGPVLLFVHGLLVSGSVFRKVVPALSKHHRCIVPDWPLGSHRAAMNPDADLRPEGIARLVAELADALDLRDVTLIGNDSGGAICQIVAARHAARIGRLVLTTCDAFEVFPPRMFEYLKLVARAPAAMGVLGRALLAFPALQRLPIAYGIVAKRGIPEGVVASWIEPAIRDAGVRRDVAKFMRGVSSRVTLEIARELPRFDRPVLVLWTPDDRSFPISLARRLVDAFPRARLEHVHDAFVFVQEDRPEALVSAIERFTRDLRAEPPRAEA